MANGTPQPVGMPARIVGALSTVQQLVIRGVLARDQIAGGVVHAVLVDVMNLCARREPFADCTLNNQHMFKHNPAIDFVSPVAIYVQCSLARLPDQQLLRVPVLSHSLIMDLAQRLASHGPAAGINAANLPGQGYIVVSHLASSVRFVG
jgi:hypothetical protein